MQRIGKSEPLNKIIIWRGNCCFRIPTIHPCFLRRLVVLLHIFSRSLLLSLSYSLSLAQCNQQSQYKSRITTQQQKNIYLHYKKYYTCCPCMWACPSKGLHACTNAQTHAHKYHLHRLQLKQVSLGGEFLEFCHSCHQTYVRDVLGIVLSNFSPVLACTWHLLMSFFLKSEPEALILFISLWLPVVARITSPRNLW
jgi:hypothetical protein